jgi:hypothetical protein
MCKGGGDGLVCGTSNEKRLKPCFHPAISSAFNLNGNTLAIASSRYSFEKKGGYRNMSDEIYIRAITQERQDLTWDSCHKINE